MWDALKDAKNGVTPALTHSEWDLLGAALEKAYADVDANATTLSSSTSSSMGSDKTMSCDETHGLSLADINKCDAKTYWKDVAQGARNQLSRMERPPSYGPRGIGSRDNLRQLIRAGKKAIKMSQVTDSEARTMALVAANDVPDQVRARAEEGDQRALVQVGIALWCGNSSKAPGP